MLKRILEKLYERANWERMHAGVHDSWNAFKRGRGPLPERYMPGKLIEKLSPEERKELEQAKPEDFQKHRLDYVRPEVHYKPDGRNDER